MAKNIKIKQVHTDTLATEPILRRAKNGELFCVCTVGGPYEPHPDNKMCVYHSKDNGKTWSQGVDMFKSEGKGIYCTEVEVDGDEITAHIATHSGRMLDWKNYVYKSFDNGYTWENYGAEPCFPDYAFVRSKITLKNGNIVLPYQYHPITPEMEKALLENDSIEDKAIWNAGAAYVDTGVLISRDGGKTYEKHIAVKVDVSDSWAWTEPTIVELSDGTIAMLIRRCRTGYLWYTESKDGGVTWSPLVNAEIPNPSNKPKLLACGDKIALLNTPNCVKMRKTEWSIEGRKPLELWISSDDMKTWESKTVLTDFPGTYSYCDGICEDGHILFTVEHNRHTILFFDVTL